MNLWYWVAGLNNRRLVTLAEHTSDHVKQTNSSTKEKGRRLGITNSKSNKSVYRQSGGRVVRRLRCIGCVVLFTIGWW